METGEVKNESQSFFKDFTFKCSALTKLSNDERTWFSPPLPQFHALAVKSPHLLTWKEI